MSFGICHLSIIPLRAQASDKSEMVSQLLFGEHFEVLSEEPKWALIRTYHDSYEGYIDKKQLFEINSKEFDELSINRFPVVGAPIHVQAIEANPPVYYLAGSILPFASKGVFKLRNESLLYNGMLSGARSNEFRPEAMKFLNAPYLWGGRTVFGIDCSGFTQLVYRLCGYTLPRDAHQQAEEGELIHLLEESQEGDLAFFDNREGRITHVGIIVDAANEKQIIHASGKVRIDKLDHQGIFDAKAGVYTHNLRLIKRMSI
jgi:gamma-D-glutamyl-L-lysine dipeptidyl-peptidase